MARINNNLIRTLRGENTGKVPFWEVWLSQDSMPYQGIVGEDRENNWQDEFIIAEKLGCEYIRVFAGGHGLPYARHETSEGTTRYSTEGGLHSLAQLEEAAPLDMEEAVSRVATRVKAAHERGLAAIAYLPWCFHATASAMGLENFAFKTVDDINFLHTVMEFVEERNRRVISEAIIPAGADAVLFDGDCAYKNGLMVNPRVFRELVFDRTAKTIAPLKKADIPYTIHSDGKLDDFIPVLIELGFSAVHGVEAQANDLADIKARFGKKITLVGNMDITFLGYSSIDEVRKATKRMLDIGSPGGRYIAACNTSPMPFIPLENYLAFVDVIRNYTPGK